MRNFLGQEGCVISEREQQDFREWLRSKSDPKEARRKPEALDDLVVLDLSRGHMGGLFCSSLLAEFGAETIRIEPPAGDEARQFSPYGMRHKDTGLGYLVEGRNKLHITLNLEVSEGREIFKKLARKADVVIETFKPGVMDAWGIGYRQLREENPRLVYAALYTYGQFGPEAACGKPDYDVTNQALSGIVWGTGEMETEGDPKPWEVPTKIGSWFGWYAGGLWAAFGIMTALLWRRESGRGQFVDVSGAEGIMRFMDCYLTIYNMVGLNKTRIGNLDSQINPYTIMECQDGYTMLAGFTDPNFFALTSCLNRPDLREDPRFDGFQKRVRLEGSKALWPILQEEVKKWKVDDLIERFKQWVVNKEGPGTPVAARVSTPLEVLSQDNWWERGVLEKVEDLVYGEVVVQAPPWKMTETPARIKWLCRPVGADNEFVYRKYLGYGPRKVRELQVRGVI
ncbi:MAG: CoA transferase [Firmicutes bacterium]|nr:CoA transferase [Bacillota bacterium]